MGVTTTLRFDADDSRRIEAVYLTPDVVEQRREVLRVLAPVAGERVLDIGSGPGLLAGDLAAAVGPSGRVCGVDLSADMLALARARDLPAGCAPVEYLMAGAQGLPYPQDTFDLAVSTQVLEYVPDVAAALAEIYRVLRPGGRLLVLDTDWDSIVWHARDAARMRRVLAAWDQHLVDPYLPRTITGGLRGAGFTVPAPRVLPLLNVGPSAVAAGDAGPATYSAGLLNVVAAFVVGRDGLTAADVAAWTADLRSLGPDYFFSLNRYLFMAEKPPTRTG
jgi:arsenite methyltransferase